MRVPFIHLRNSIQSNRLVRKGVGRQLRHRDNVEKCFLSKDTTHLYTWVERGKVELGFLSKDTTHFYTSMERDNVE